jgi:hypothetical protein
MVENCKSRPVGQSERRYASDYLITNGEPSLRPLSNKKKASYQIKRPIIEPSRI